MGLSNAFPEVKAFFQNIGSSISEILGGIDFGSIFSAAISIGLVVALFKIANFLNSLASPFEGFGEVLNSVSKATKSFSTALKAEAIKSIAISILILVGAIAILTMLDTGKMITAAIVIGALLCVVAFLLKTITKMGSTADAQI
jgi:hypothetical protein